MLSEDLNQYVRNSLSLGMPEETIRDSLIGAGWSSENIDYAIEVAKAPLYKPKRKRLPTFLAASALSFLVIALAGTVYFLWQDRLDLGKTNTKKAQQFYAQLSRSMISFEDSGRMIFPDEQKFLNRKEEYIADKADFIEADLKQMVLTLYHNGSPRERFKILTKGKAGSWWETPTGDYAAIGKEMDHFSSIGRVWMPYSIQFFGNYFIHGWPHYDDGTPVSHQYSGGCIRLSDNDAKIVYSFAKKGMPVLVLGEDANVLYAELSPKTQGAPLPPLSAASFLVANISTGERILQKDANSKRATASLAKLMTAVVAHELVYLGRQIRATKVSDANTTGAETPHGFQFVAGEYYTGFDLLYPLLMQSSNDAANIISAYSGNAFFVKNMNDKAASLWMMDTSFADASGVSADDISTADDLTRLLDYIYYKRRFILDIGKGHLFESSGLIKIGDSISIDQLKNFNEFASNPDLIGMKNGETNAAGQTMASIWNIHTPSGDVPVSIIILGSKDRGADTLALLNWLKQNFMTL